MNREIREIRVAELMIHPTVHREIDWKWVQKLAEEFDADSVGVFDAVEYQCAGKKGVFVIDGVHRMQAMIRRGLGQDYVTVMIHTDVHDDASAARLWLAFHATKDQYLHNPDDRECSCPQCETEREADASAVADVLSDCLGLPRTGNA